MGKTNENKSRLKFFEFGNYFYRFSTNVFVDLELYYKVPHEYDRTIWCPVNGGNWTCDVRLITSDSTITRDLFSGCGRQVRVED